MNWSDFGHKLTAKSGILELMDDLGRALQGDGEKIMLGGGNPAAIPEMNRVWRRRMQEVMAQGDSFERMVGNYDTPQGKAEFLEALAGMLRQEYGWDVGPEHIGITNGSQSAFFILFNLLSGRLDAERGQGVSRLGRGLAPDADPVHRENHHKILLPLTPEYIGYADQGIGEDHFVSQRPLRTPTGDHEFKYQVDIPRLTIGPDIGALCVSRPTNPTGNVLTDDEMAALDQLARDHGIPLVVDNAYGAPFPHILFTEVKPIWNPNIILGLSLSKIGLPGTRTGILVARPEVIEAVSAVNAITSLASGSLGQVLVSPLLANGELLALSRKVIRPYYEQRSLRARQSMAHHFQGLPWSVHKSEGALFLWLCFDHPQMDTSVLYQRLKARNVLVVPGAYFFYGLDNATRQPDPWDHRRHCLRVNYAAPPEAFDRGMAILAEEVRALIGG